MSDTTTLQRPLLTARSPISSADVEAISPADAEAALLANYPDLVRIAYALLPAYVGRHRRVIAAHGVVQRALPDHRRLERLLRGATDARSFVRDRVRQEAIKQAQARTPWWVLPQVWGLRLLAWFAAPDNTSFDPCSLQPVRRTELARRNACGRTVAILVTSLLALGILATLIAEAVNSA
ncbi:hypothetical protein EV138_1935 [Kribbella voronezhensis]|uniref:DNA-directed RNA polymerase specialized sigma24 family protein n=1 Tax=Kribbella voronezhensis TaxID=2512212 RepID=A0A4R7T904_9ACTN|nr:hypothetical protein [Kribbella voronezhensis]TDU88391.1 hypothetical protein EV138_1935 [Kribbella voronezhensis]